MDRPRKRDSNLDIIFHTLRGFCCQEQNVSALLCLIFLYLEYLGTVFFRTATGGAKFLSM